MRAKKPFHASEFGESSICLHLGLTDPARRKKLSVTPNGVTRFNQQVDRFSDLVDTRDLMSILR
jgi:hypothetical protein